ncbi:MAG: hypothetical protein IKZ53_04045 [Selenomonadaceae bacterium]|nr:hypothetical protein [Selenomonadaceae bacterium]
MKRILSSLLIGAFVFGLGASDIQSVSASSLDKAKETKQKYDKTRDKAEQIFDGNGMTRQTPPEPPKDKDGNPIAPPDRNSDNFNRPEPPKDKDGNPIAPPDRNSDNSNRPEPPKDENGNPLPPPNFNGDNSNRPEHNQR